MTDRSDVTVTFTHALGPQSIHELGSIPGVIETEPERSVAVVFRNGTRSYRGAINALVPEPRLKRALDDKKHPHPAAGTRHHPVALPCRRA